ncbi:unnamed protein product [Gadus morhua 'NCC']
MPNLAGMQAEWPKHQALISLSLSLSFPPPPPPPPLHIMTCCQKHSRPTPKTISSLSSVLQSPGHKITGGWPGRVGSVAGGERLKRASVLVRVGTAGGLPNTCSISGEQ